MGHHSRLCWQPLCGQALARQALAVRDSASCAPVVRQDTVAQDAVAIPDAHGAPTVPSRRLGMNHPDTKHLSAVVYRLHGGVQAATSCVPVECSRQPLLTALCPQYQLMVGGVVPRPIAFISGISADGVENLTPFSWFNIVTSDPAVISLSLLHHQPTTDASALKDIAASILAAQLRCQARLRALSTAHQRLRRQCAPARQQVDAQQPYPHPQLQSPAHAPSSMGSSQRALSPATLVSSNCTGPTSYIIAAGRSSARLPPTAPTCSQRCARIMDYPRIGCAVKIKIPAHVLRPRSLFSFDGSAVKEADPAVRRLYSLAARRVCFSRALVSPLDAHDVSIIIRFRTNHGLSPSVKAQHGPATIECVMACGTQTPTRRTLR
ncbi:predicted protein [Postia placenta Mad-698-R]|nr:predicted protein [Postia placenta Mad-698-R]